MTEYVVDTSVLIQGFVIDTQTAHVRTLLFEALNPAIPTILHLPEFCLVECANVLWKRVRFHDADEQASQTTLTNLLNFPLHVHESGPLLSRAFEIALNNHLAVYDCVHVALAETLSCPLITVDQRQAAIAQRESIMLKAIIDFPEYQPRT